MVTHLFQSCVLNLLTEMSAFKSSYHGNLTIIQSLLYQIFKFHHLIDTAPQIIIIETIIINILMPFNNDANGFGDDFCLETKT